jgi:phage shock protein B
LSDDDRESIDTMLVTVDKLNERIVSLEAILEADHPNWKQQEHTRGES